jgi:enamine deaminase RidA (YjgF/YER057c/UK114 family)
MPSPTQQQAVISRQISHGEWTERQTTICGQDAVSEQFGSATQCDVFGVSDRIFAAERALQAAGVAARLTGVISGAGADGGIQIGSMEGLPTVPICVNGRVMGQTFEDASAKYCLLGGLYPSDLTASPSAQAEEVFGMIERALAGAGMDFRQVVRTWFYNDDILAWYAGFNRVRTAFFKEHGVTLMPASTGIGAPNIVGAALVAKVIAVLPKTSALQVRKAESPLQCDAFDYGSAFSRAIEVAGPHVRKLYISGTASIEPGGKTVHVGNASLQIAKTMEVVEAILHKAGMGLGDTTRAIAYFRHPEHIALWRDFCRTKPLKEFPVIEVGCTICRDDLLFEIELDAARETEG